ncbi:hypothetical protein IAJ44_004332 [Salmonella enterica]|nr:hypothetical protein [Salmonella enterica]
MTIQTCTDLEDQNLLVESELAKSDASEWVIIHSFLVDKEERRCCVSPPMLALKWQIAETVFNSLLKEGLMNVARQAEGHAWLARLNNEKDVFRVGIFKEHDPEGVPEEVLMLMDRRSLTDEIYHDLYVKDTTGEVSVVEVPLHAPKVPPKPVYH